MQGVWFFLKFLTDKALLVPAISGIRHVKTDKVEPVIIPPAKNLSKNQFPIFCRLEI